MKQVKQRHEPFGRPTKYKPEYCQDIIEYFQREPFTPVYDANGDIAFDKNGKPVLMPCSLPTLSGYAVKLGVNPETVLNWTKKHEDFLESYKLAKAMQEEILIQNGLAGNYEKAFTIFLAKNITSMKDYKHVEVDQKDTTYGIEQVKSLSTTKKADQKWQIEFVDKSSLMIEDASREEGE